MFANPQNRKDYPAFVLFPQCPPSTFWPFESQPASYDATTFPIDYPTSTPIKLVKELIDSYLQMEEIDKDRIYILGISMGGMGTFDIACRYPETFAAAIPICGGVNVERLDNKVKNIYWRLFHGDADGVVPVNNSRQAYQKLTNIKADAEYIEVPGASHFVWDEVFKREDFLSWIFAQKRQSTGGSDIETGKTDTSLRCYCYNQMLYIDTNDQTPLKANVYTTSGALVHSSCYNRSSIVSPLTSIIRKTKCSSVLKQNVLFYKTKRTSVNLFSYPNWHKKAPKKYVFFGAFYCSVFWLSHQKSLTLNKYIIFGFNAILIPLKRRYIIPPESWARHRLYSIMSVYVAL